LVASCQASSSASVAACYRSSRTSVAACDPAAVGTHRSVRSYLAGIDRDLRPYLIGFALALILTAIPFALVATNPLPKPTTLIIIAVAAAIQVLVHLRYFLHLNLTSTPRENLVAIVFTCHSHCPHGRRQLLDHVRSAQPNGDVISSERRTLHKSTARMRGLPVPATIPPKRLRRACGASLRGAPPMQCSRGSRARRY
jgi:cytochrome o ubiquinol oxidase operon protein cyoD